MKSIEEIFLKASVAVVCACAPFMGYTQSADASVESIALDSGNEIQIISSELAKHPFYGDRSAGVLFMIYRYDVLECDDENLSILCNPSVQYHTFEKRDSAWIHSFIPLQEEGIYYDGIIEPIWVVNCLKNEYIFELLYDSLVVRIRPEEKELDADYLYAHSIVEPDITLDSIFEGTNHEQLFIVSVGRDDSDVNPHWQYKRYWISDTRGVVKIEYHSCYGHAETKLSGIYFVMYNDRKDGFKTVGIRKNFTHW